jgi:hypothetical protein
MNSKLERVRHAVGSRSDWLEMRRRNVNASDIAALFHANPYKTALELWALHSGQLQDEDRDSMALRRGRILESAVAASLRETHPEWVIEPAGEYVEIPTLRLGCTPDFYAWPSAEDRRAGANMFAIQAKTVLEGVYLDEWAAAPPAHYLIQVQTEMMVLGIDRILLAPMVLDAREFPVHEWFFKADEEFHAAIDAQVRKFWRHVEQGIEPQLKPSQDGSTLARLFPAPNAEATLTLHGDGDFVRVCAEHLEVRARINELEARKDELGALVMNRLRNHARAEAQDFKVSWTPVPAATVVQNRKAHRRLTINKVKRKGE